MALTITEDWVRERVQLKHSNLEDVRSLSLPGTYHEKIAVLGVALRSFTRLKHLDLSRNAIDSLQGLENLKMLEKLNLYYNNIGGLQELYRLRQNQKLQELDLRLNPVARNEPDYRLFLIHMLPNLRRLDDRAVRDSERKAALMHFSSEQAATLGEPQKRPPPAGDKHTNPRVEHVKSLGKPSSVLEDDDVALLDLISRPGNELTGITGSAAAGPNIQDYSPESVRKMNLAGVGLGEQGPVSAGMGPTLACEYQAITPTSIVETEASLPAYGATTTAEALQQRYPNIPVIVATPPSPQHKEPSRTSGQGNQEQGTRKNRVQFADDANLKFQDELEAYTSYKARGQFTPNPGSASSSNRVPVTPVSAPPGPPRPETAFGANPYYPPAASSKSHHQYDYDGGQPGVELYNKYSNGNNDKVDSSVYQELPSTHSVAPSSITAASSVFHAGNTFLSNEGGPDPPANCNPCDPLVQQISDLVDRYWNGAKSLQSNQKFQVLLNTLLRNHLGTSLTSDVEKEQRLSQVEEEVTRLRAENLQLRERTALPADLENTEEGKLKSMLIRAQRDLSILRSRLQMSMEENRSLQDKVSVLEKGSSNMLRDGHPKLEELQQIKRENENLRQEISGMSGRLKQSTQLQELANMLQDSHKSLVQTNEHLLRELEETRARHDQEVRQLHWSYDQLKTSIGYTPKMGNASSVLNGKPSP